MPGADTRQDEVKHVGFAHAAFTKPDVYERGRSGYPAAAVELLVAELGLGPGSTVLDLGAGTGKLTRLLGGSGARVLAAEPVEAMRSELARTVPSALPLGATAESLPLRGAVLDAVTVAQAFHWFAFDRALSEIHRVLRPGGGLGLVWNRADTSVPWVARLDQLRSPAPRSPREWAREARARLRRATGRSPKAGSGQPPWVAKTRQAFATETAGRLFSPLVERSFRHGEEMDADRLVDWVTSFSRFSRLTAPERDDVVTRVRRLAAQLPHRFEFPYRTDLFWCRAR